MVRLPTHYENNGAYGTQAAVGTFEGNNYGDASGTANYQLAAWHAARQVLPGTGYPTMASLLASLGYASLDDYGYALVDTRGSTLKRDTMAAAFTAFGKSLDAGAFL